MKHALRASALLLLLVLSLSTIACQSGVDVPDGMQLCSQDHLEYYFFVPTNWVDNTVSGSTSAYYSSGDDRVSVLVSSYLPEEALDVAGYWDLCEKDYKSALANYTLLSPADGTVTQVGGLDAYEFVFTGELSGVAYKYSQTIFVSGGRFYTITYTAVPDSYELHLEELALMKTHFTFR